MDSNIPEELQEKLKIIEKEMYFSQKIRPPTKRQSLYMLLGIVGFLIVSIDSAIEGNYFETLFLVILAFLFIAIHFEYKRFYKLYSNARDIISYYRDREKT